MEDSVEMIAVCVVTLPGKRIAPGGDFECNEALAEKLHANGSAGFKAAELASNESVVVAGGDDSETSGSGAAGDTAEFDGEAVEALLASWLDEDPEREDSTKWTQSKNPKNAVLDELFGFDVKNADVKPIFNALLAERDAAT